MLNREIDPDTGLNRVTETRVVAVPDLARRKCTCDMARCLWYPLPRRPIGDLVHVLESRDDQPWFPRHHSWQDGAPSELLCWKCGRVLKGWRPKLTPFGDHVYVDGLPAVHFTLYDHYRAKRFQARLPKMGETVQFDALHCADCELTAADGMHVVAIYLSGLLEAHRHGEELAKRLKLATTHTPDRLATYFSRWEGVEPIGPINRVDDSTEPKWRSQMAEHVTQLPTQGHILTALDYLMTQDRIARATYQPGMMIKYLGPGTLPGWIRCTGDTPDPTVHPRLALVLRGGPLPNDPEWLIKL